MNFKKVNNISGWIICAIACTIFIMTREASVSFWDFWFSAVEGIVFGASPLFIRLRLNIRVRQIKYPKYYYFEKEDLPDQRNKNSIYLFFYCLRFCIKFLFIIKITHAQG